MPPVYVFGKPLRACGFGNPHLNCAGFQIQRSRNRRCSILAALSRTIPYVCVMPCDCAAGMPHLLYCQNDSFGCALTLCSFSPSEIRVFGRRAGTARKKRSHTRHAEIKMSRNPLQTCPFDGTRTLPAQKSDRRESPPGDSADKMTRETCSGKSSNGKEKRPRSRRENVSVPGFFHTSPEIKIPSPEKRIPGLGISRSGSEFSRRTAQKVNYSDKILHRSPVLCKKIAQESAI